MPVTTDTVSTPTLGTDQQTVYDRVLAGGNALISGPAGTGKSFLLERLVGDLRRNGRAVAVTASTGIAALNVGGSTIHSFLGTGLKGHIADLHQHYPDLNERVDLAQRLQGVNVLVVDEISMLTGDYLEMMSRWLGYARQKRRGQPMTPFGGVQVIFCGDFLQLPPVQTRTGRQATHLYAFEHPVWPEAAITPFVLRENFRQADADFVQHLLAIREGAVPQPARDFFKPCVGRPLDQPTWLLSRNDRAQARNHSELKRMTGKTLTYAAELRGHDKWQDALRKNCIAEEHLRLKRGAPVIFLKNNADLGYVNGMRGVVHQVTPTLVQIRKPNGAVVPLERARWELKDAHAKLLASLTQYPVKLAFALTVHKAQGLTLDCVRCDLSDVFEAGHAYVALSRARTVEGLALAHPLVAGQIRVSAVAARFYQELGA